jgi:hypothetical protein
MKKKSSACSSQHANPNLSESTNLQVCHGSPRALFASTYHVASHHTHHKRSFLNVRGQGTTMFDQIGGRVA